MGTIACSFVSLDVTTVQCFLITGDKTVCFLAYYTAVTSVSTVLHRRDAAMTHLSKDISPEDWTVLDLQSVSGGSRLIPFDVVF